MQFSDVPLSDEPRSRPFNRMWVRLSLYFSGFAVVSALLLVIAAQLLVTDRVRQSLLPEQLQAPGGMVDTLGEYYQDHGSWQGVDNLMRGAQATFRLWSRGLDLAIVDRAGNSVYIINQRQAGRPPPGSPLENNPKGNDPLANGPMGSDTIGRPRIPIRLPITSNGETVGYLEARTMLMPSVIASETDPFQLFSRYLLIVAIGGGLLGIIFGILAGRNLTTPLTELANAARAIGAGNLQQRVSPTGSEEIAAVATAFNEMATQLEAAETLRRNLMADVAHELRTPLSVLQGNLRAILDDVYELDKSEVTKLYTQSRLLSRLVNDLHELAQAEAGQLPLNLLPTDLRPLLQETFDLFMTMAEDAGIRLQPALSPTLPAAVVDAVRLRQVLHNLIGNALRYTPAGGTVTIKSAVIHGDKHQWVTMSIQDSGEGIASEHLSHVFDRFYRTDRARARDTGGTGLGLAIVRAIVHAHHGDIHVHSDGIGKGTTFTVTLPVAETTPSWKMG